MSEYNFSIEAINVNKTYNKKKDSIKALDDFNINIPKGSIFGLLRTKWSREIYIY